MSRLARISIFTLVAIALAGRGASAQQSTGTVTGRVTDADARRPVPSAQVFVVGTAIGTRTDADGSYRLVGVPAGTVTLRYTRIGFQGATRSVAVPAGAVVTQDVVMATAPTVLTQVVTTASGTEQSRRENGASVARVDAAALDKTAIQNFSQVLTGRTPGVTVAQSSGTTGTGARVRIRGANSMSLSNEPLLIIDGVRIDNNPESNSLDVGGQTPSRLNDINPEDIESFDVIKGPAAAALYGTAAANGVIQITTKRGGAGKATWTAIGEVGGVRETNNYPANYGSWTMQGLYDIPSWPVADAGGNPLPNPTCSLYYEAKGYCTVDSLAAYNTIKESHPFRFGRRQKVGASVSGGLPAVTYFLSSDVESESGIYSVSNLNRLNLRGNLGAHPTPNVDLSVSTGYVSSTLQLPQNDNNYYGVISDGIAGFPANGSTQGYNPLPPSQFDQIDTRQEIGRFTGGVNGTWRILPWLSANATLGMDALNRFDNQTIQPNTVFFGDDVLGSRQSNRIETNNITTNYALTARSSITESLNSVAQVGYQYQRAQNRGTYASGKTLTAGSGTLGGVNSERLVSEPYADNKTAGGFISEQLAYRDRLFVTGTLRADKNSAFGKNFGLVKYPAASISYVLAENGERLSQMRLRAAYGESGLRPGILDALEYSNPVAVRLNNGDRAGVTVGNLANPGLKAEKTREVELGFDAGFFQDRATLEMTYYDKRSRDALVLKPFAVSLGGPVQRYVNVGAVSNKGIEFALTTTPYRTEQTQFNLTITGSGNRNRLEKLGADKPIVFGFAQRHVEGYPLGGFWGTTIDSVHVGSNGRVYPDSVYFSMDESKVHYLGSALPTRQGSVSGDLTLFKLFKISTMFEYRGGNKLFNATEQFRCAFGICRGVNDPKAPIDEQANAEAASDQSNFVGAYVEDASFVKWRELSVGVNLASRYLQSLRATDALLTFGVRNLHTWTNYTGLDPEVNVYGQTNFISTDFLTQPQVRYYTARLTLTF
jgi:TonB-linked SusC/RagA family outer membrane protein